MVSGQMSNCIEMVADIIKLEILIGRLRIERCRLFGLIREERV